MEFDFFDLRVVEKNNALVFQLIEDGHTLFLDQVKARWLPSQNNNIRFIRQNIVLGETALQVEPASEAWLTDHKFGFLESTFNKHGFQMPLLDNKGFLNADGLDVGDCLWVARNSASISFSNLLEKQYIEGAWKRVCDRVRAVTPLDEMKYLLIDTGKNKKYITDIEQEKNRALPDVLIFSSLA